MRKQIIIFMILLLSFGVLLIGCASDSTNAGSKNDTNNDKKVTLKLGHVVSTESHYQVFATKLKELVEQKSNGSISIDIFPQGQLGGEVAMFQATQDGTLDILVLGQSALTNTIKELAIFDLPYIFDSIEQANKILSGDIGKKFLENMSNYDVIGLSYLSTIDRNVFSKKPIYTASDIKGLKLRDSQVNSYLKTFEALGAQPVPMPYNEVYMALQQGVVDGASSAPDNFINDKFVEVAEYYNLTKIFYLPVVSIASEKTWDKLTDEQKNIIMESVDEATRVAIDFYGGVYDKALKEAEERGVKIIKTDINSIKEAVEPLYPTLLEGIPNGQQLFEEIQKAKAAAN